MYLNIINNIKYENKRKGKSIDFKKKSDENLDEQQEVELKKIDDFNSYYSIFYGDLTKNWINLNPKRNIQK